MIVCKHEDGEFKHQYTVILDDGIPSDWDKKMIKLLDSLEDVWEQENRIACWMNVGFDEVE